ncbi:MAG TPA: hypothetical protein PKY53_00095 [Clostridia bacterium]|nr:hypothetical protein [Clostridia bacterium]
MLKLAIRSCFESKIRALSVIFTVAISAVMLFLCFSYPRLIEKEFDNTTKTEAENADIRIEYSSDADSRIMSLDGLETVADKTEFIVGVLDLYGTSVISGKTEYINLRGVTEDGFRKLNNTETKKSINRKLRSDEIIIDEYTSAVLGLDLDSSIKITIGTKTKTFYVAEIVNSHPIFETAGAHVFYCMENATSDFIGGRFGGIYNKVFIKAAQGITVENLIAQIKTIPDYSGQNVTTETDSKLGEKVQNASLPMIVALAACSILAVYLVYLIINSGLKRRTLFISRLKTVGADNGYVVGVFSAESFVFSIIGIVIGAIVNLSLIFGAFPDADTMFFIKTLMISSAVTLVAFFVCMLLPSIHINKLSVRTQYTQGKTTLRKQSNTSVTLGVVLFLSAVILILPKYLDFARGIISLILLFTGAILALPHIVGLVLIPLKDKISGALGYLAVYNTGREKLTAEIMRILFAGIVICSILASAANLTGALKDSLQNDIDCDIVINNVKADGIQLNAIKNMPGISDVHAVNLKTAFMTKAGEEFELTLISSRPEELPDMVNITYVTQKEKLLSGLNDGIALNYSYHKMHKMNIGDEVTLKVNNIEKQVTVTAFFNSLQYGGRSAITSNEFLSDTFGIPFYDTIILNTSGDVEDTVIVLRASFGDENLIIVSKESLYSAYVGILDSTSRISAIFACAIIAVCFISVLFNVLNAREEKKSEILKMSLAGFDKKGIALVELIEYALCALISIAAALTVSPVVSKALTNSFALGSLYVENPLNYAFVAIIGAGFLLLMCAAALTSYFSVKKEDLIRLLRAE